ncbi:MBL fold metallo-hydrolase [Streptomyces griseoluteus]|uniref:MBL fold metallo-hydrolase n=1 Tax=Streptomyces griseoluteus TaxID=29306 RepID=UPI0037FB466C
MKLTKRGHACVRLENDGGVLVIDPGLWSEEDAAAGADAILVTHEHFDHFDEERLRFALEANPAAGLWAPAVVADQVAAAFPNRVHTVGEGDALTLAGFDVQVHGEWHAMIHPDIPRISNVGYFVDGSVFHPGDALTVLDQSGRRSRRRGAPAVVAGREHRRLGSVSVISASGPVEDGRDARGVPFYTPRSRRLADGHRRPRRWRCPGATRASGATPGTDVVHLSAMLSG